MTSTILFSSRRSIQTEVELDTGSAVALVRFGQEIDESVAFYEIFKTLYAAPAPIKTVRFDFKKTTRINSPGSRNWLHFIQEDLQQMYRIEFAYLSECLVSLAGMWPGALGVPRGRIEVIEVPHLCKACGTRSLDVFRPEEIRRAKDGYKLREVTCAACGKAAKIDVIPAEYFDGILT